MKNWLVLLLMISGFHLFGQNPNYKKGLSTRALFMDYQSQNGGDISAFNNYHHGFELAFHSRLNENVKLVIPFNVGQVTSHVKNNLENEEAWFHKTVYGIGGQIQYEFGNLESQVVPYLVGGIDGVFEREGEFNLQVPIGFGLNFKQADNVYWFWQSDYRFSLGDDRNNLHHGIGFVYLWDGQGGMPKKEEKKDMIDSDGDGIVNDLDLCPNAAGTKALSGCPDKDGDGVADYEDKCPEKPGLKSYMGCPDTDGDGVADNEDECPEMVGLVSNKGCPDGDRDNDGVPNSIDQCPDLPGTVENKGCPGADSDGDGVADNIDKCPNEKGSKAANGCPDRDGDGVPDYADKCIDKAGLAVYGGCPDTDGDGIDDSRDRCPNKFGSVATNGCPEIAQEDKRVLELAMRAVQFDTGRASLKSESYEILRQISSIMGRYPDYNLTISGHTDSVGDANSNLRLSEKRAKSCYEYLQTLGVLSSRMKYQGFGEAQPISDNNSLRGRALNRRTEFTLSPR